MVLIGIDPYPCDMDGLVKLTWNQQRVLGLAIVVDAHHLHLAGHRPKGSEGPGGSGIGFSGKPDRIHIGNHRFGHVRHGGRGEANFDPCCHAGLQTLGLLQHVPTMSSKLRRHMEPVAITLAIYVQSALDASRTLKDPIGTTLLVVLRIEPSQHCVPSGNLKFG